MRLGSATRVPFKAKARPTANLKARPTARSVSRLVLVATVASQALVFTAAAAPAGAAPAVALPAAATGTITEFRPAGISQTATSDPLGITTGPDGNLWFTESDANAIGRITTSGSIAEFPVPTPASQPSGIASGPDGNLWFAERDGDKIGRIDTSGNVTEFPLPAASQPAKPQGIATGPDGALWFTESGRDQIGRIDTGGAIAEYGPFLNPGMTAVGIASGPDGGLWFTEYDGNRLGRATTGGVITELPAFPTPNSEPNRIVSGPDGNLWVTESDTGRIASVTPDIPPVVVTGDADKLAQSTATLHGSVNPSRSATTYHFEYGIDTNYSTSTPDQSLDAGSDPVDVHTDLQGLVPSTLYHFRLVASNANGVTNGKDKELTTQAPPPPGPPGPPPRELRPKPLGIQLHVTPRLDRKPPFRFKASGYVLVPPGTPIDQACNGTVRVIAKLGKRTLRKKTVHVDVDCGYAAHFRWKDLIRYLRKPRMAMKFSASFSGNDWLKPLAAKPAYGRVG